MKIKFIFEQEEFKKTKTINLKTPITKKLMLIKEIESAEEKFLCDPKIDGDYGYDFFIEFDGKKFCDLNEVVEYVEFK